MKCRQCNSQMTANDVTAEVSGCRKMAGGEA